MPDPNVAANTAGIFVVILPDKKNGKLRTVLVLDKPETVDQIDGTSFEKVKMWGVPKGRCKPEIDADLIACALREWYEETGNTEITREMIVPKLSIVETEASKRPGANEHHKTFFLVVTDKAPQLGIPLDPKIEKAQVFSLSELPVSQEVKLARSHARMMLGLFRMCQELLLKSGVHPMTLAMCEATLESRVSGGNKDPNYRVNR